MRNIFITFLVMALSIQSTFACKCDVKDDIKAHYSNTDVIVHAKVLNKEYVTFSSTLTNNGLVSVKSTYNAEPEKIEFLKFLGKATEEGTTMLKNVQEIDTDLIVSTVISIVRNYLKKDHFNEIVTT